MKIKSMSKIICIDIVAAPVLCCASSRADGNSAAAQLGKVTLPKGPRGEGPPRFLSQSDL